VGPVYLFDIASSHAQWLSLRQAAISSNVRSSIFESRGTISTILFPAITDRVSPRAQELVEILRAAGLRAEADLRSEKIGHKIREAQLEKIPFMLVLGDREAESGQISVRSRSRGDLGVSSVESFVGMARDLVASRSRDN